MKVKQIEPDKKEWGKYFRMYSLVFDDGTKAQIQGELDEGIWTWQIEFYIAVDEIFEDSTIAMIQAIKAFKLLKPDGTTASETYEREGDAYYYFYPSDIWMKKLITKHLQNGN